MDQPASALLLQVNTAWQVAAATVASYPFLPNYIITEALAASRGEPSFEELVIQQCTSRRHLTWNHINQYNRILHLGNLLTYVPFLPAVSQKLLCS